MAINAGIGYEHGSIRLLFFCPAKEAVEKGEVSLSRIDDAVGASCS